MEENSKYKTTPTRVYLKSDFIKFHTLDATKNMQNVWRRCHTL